MFLKAPAGQEFFIIERIGNVEKCMKLTRRGTMDAVLSARRSVYTELFPYSDNSSVPNMIFPPVVFGSSDVPLYCLAGLP